MINGNRGYHLGGALEKTLGNVITQIMLIV